MNDRLQRKCFIASAGFHLSLAAILLVGPAFLSSKKSEPTQRIEFTPDSVIEAALAGGGSPNAHPPAPPQPPTPESYPPAQPPTPQPRQPVQPPEPPRPVTPARDPAETRTEKKRPNVSLTEVTRPKNNTPTPRRPTTNSESQSDAADERAKQIAGAAKSAARAVRSGTSSSTTVSMPEGPGGGGPSYASYNSEVQRVYKLRYDAFLLAAGDIAEEQASVEVSVTIKRDGNVVSTRIVSPSVNPALNRLVQRVLDAVTFIRAFPEGATDSQRTLNIIFDLKPKRIAG
ncbi:MAG: TonB family protein [Pedosphaera sp.]|nr:TonB family protein [Pedosphaera sp.]